MPALAITLPRRRRNSPAISPPSGVKATIAIGFGQMQRRADVREAEQQRRDDEREPCCGVPCRHLPQHGAERDLLDEDRADRVITTPTAARRARATRCTARRLPWVSLIHKCQEPARIALGEIAPVEGNRGGGNAYECGACEKTDVERLQSVAEGIVAGVPPER